MLVIGDGPEDPTKHVMGIESTHTPGQGVIISHFAGVKTEAEGRQEMARQGPHSLSHEPGVGALYTHTELPFSIILATWLSILPLWQPLDILVVLFCTYVSVCMNECTHKCVSK